MPDSFFLTDMIGIPVTAEFQKAALKRKAKEMDEAPTDIFLDDVEYTDPRVKAQGDEISDTKPEQK
jgi:hypothetical protein